MAKKIKAKKTAEKKKLTPAAKSTVKKQAKPATKPKKAAVKKAAAKKTVKKAAAKKPVAKKAVKKVAATTKKKKAIKPAVKKTATKKTAEKIAAKKSLKLPVIAVHEEAPPIIPINELIEKVIAQDPIRSFDKHVFSKATAKGDPRSKLHLNTKSKKPKMPSAKKPLWKK